MKRKKSNPAQDMAFGTMSLLSLGVVMFSIYKVGKILANTSSNTVSIGVRG